MFAVHVSGSKLSVELFGELTHRSGPLPEFLLQLVMSHWLHDMSILRGGLVLAAQAELVTVLLQLAEGDGHDHQQGFLHVF